MKNKKDSLKVFKRAHHINREDLGEEHPYGDSGQAILLVVFLVIWVLDSFIFKLSTVLAKYIPLYLRLILAGLVFMVSAYLAQSGLRVVFSEVRDPPQVIKTGVFSRMRHPIYLAALLFYAGLIFTTLSLISLAFWVGIFIFYNYIATFEEKRLEQKFGQEYVIYQKKVPKWLPCLRSSVLNSEN